jgi:hypothetical protein
MIEESGSGRPKNMWIQWIGSGTLEHSFHRKVALHTGNFVHLLYILCCQKRQYNNVTKNIYSRSRFFAYEFRTKHDVSAIWYRYQCSKSVTFCMETDADLDPRTRTFD